MRFVWGCYDTFSKEPEKTTNDCKLIRTSEQLQFGAVQTCVKFVDLLKRFPTSIHHLVAKVGENNQQKRTAGDTAENEPPEVWPARTHHSSTHPLIPLIHQAV